jgi:hypothetical protein
MIRANLRDDWREFIKAEGGLAQPFSPVKTTTTEAAPVFAGFEGRGSLLAVPGVPQVSVFLRGPSPGAPGAARILAQKGWARPQGWVPRTYPLGGACRGGGETGSPYER